MNQARPITTKIIEGIVWSSGSSFSIKLVGLLSTVTILRVLSAAEFGLYQLVLSAYGILASLSFVGFDQIVLNDLMRAKSEGNDAYFKRLFSEFAAFKILIGFALFAVSLAGANIAGAIYGESIALFVRIISPLFLIVAFERVLSMLLSINLSFRAISLFTFIEEITKLAFLLFFFFVADLGAQSILLALVSAAGLTLLMFIPYGIKLYRPVAKLKALNGRMIMPASFLSYGKWAIGAKYVNDLQRYVRPWLLKIFLTTEAVGIYTMAENLYAQAVGLVPLGTVLMPIVSKNIRERSRMKDLLYFGAKYGMVPFFMLAILAAVAIPWFVETLFPQHLAAIPLFYLLLLVMPPAAFASILTAVFYAERRQKAHFMITFLTLLVTLILAPIFLKQFGVMGMALEFVTAAYFYNALRAWYVWKSNPDLRFPFLKLFQWGREDMKFFQNLAGMAALLVSIKKMK